MSRISKKRPSQFSQERADSTARRRKDARQRVRRAKVAVLCGVVALLVCWGLFDAQSGSTQTRRTPVRQRQQPARESPQRQTVPELSESNICVEQDDDDAPVNKMLRYQVPGRDLRADPPQAKDVSLQILDKPTDAGNVALRVQFDKEERLPEQLTVQLEDRQVTLRDDGREGDERAGDQVFSAVTTLDLDDLRKSQERLRGSPNKSLPVFVGREQVGERRVSDLLLDIRPGRVLRFPFPGPFPGPAPGDPANIDIERSLMITNPRVVQDPTRTRASCGGTSMGKWSFGYLMEQMANTPVSGITPQDFVRRWLNRWMFDQNVNDWTVARRVQIQTQIIQPWEAASGVGPGGPLDLSKAPFRLLAIVNRVDLRQNLVYGGGSAGEARFVFSAVSREPSCTPLPFTVIFEYGIRKRNCADLRAWARQWKDLDTHPIGSVAYRNALEAITEQFVRANSAPTKPNGSALNQLRTNEIALSSPWQLREFQIFSTDSDAGHLREVTVKQNPDDSINRTQRLADYVNANAAAIINEMHTVPLEFPAGDHFLGGATQVPNPATTFWDGPTRASIPNRFARHKFSLQTCNACHGGETRTRFTHIEQTGFGPTAAGLSKFLTGNPPPGNPPSPATPFVMPDVADGSPDRRFNDLVRRAADLDSLVNSPCFFQIGRPRLRMTH